MLYLKCNGTIPLQCSVSCGVGIKQRDVICRNESGQLSAALRCAGEKPPDTEPCHRKCTQVLSSRVSETAQVRARHCLLYLSTEARNYFTVPGKGPY